MNNTESIARFASFRDLQQTHLSMMRRQSSNPANEAARKTETVEFIKRVVATGAILEGEQRQASQNILEYWCADSATYSDATSSDWVLPKLDPFLAAEALPAEGDSVEAGEPARNARRSIRLSATARLWKDSGRAPGYLLNGQALEEASSYADDPDVADLVKASRASIRSRWIYRGLIVAVLALLVIVAGLLVRIQLASKQLQALQDAQDAAVAYKSATVLRSQVDTQQKQIGALTAELNKANIAVPSEISETVPDAVAQSSEPSSRPRDSLPPSALPAVQKGFIWIGPNTSPNLIDVKTQTPVKPTDVVLGTEYKVTKNLVLRSAAPNSNYVQSDGIGIVPQQTGVRVIGAPIPYWRPSYATTDKSAVPSYQTPAPSDIAGPPGTTAQYWAEVEVRASDQPMVYVQYMGASATADAFTQQLKTSSFRIPGMESTDLAKGLNEVRFYHPEERESAKRLADSIPSVAEQLRLPGLAAPKLVDLTAKAGPRNFPGVVELWIDLSAARP
jgi:hypothetical protein